MTEEQEKMIWCEPSYMKEFRCTADKCSDTCCAGWEIVLDDDALERYEQTEGSFGKRLRREIKRDGEEAYFALTPKKRCPFLDEHNLCDIYRELGEEALCDICTEHPRFYNWVGDYTEKGLGLCCEEAERLMFAAKAPLYFEFHGDTEDEEGISEDLKVLLQIRGEAFSILQDREEDIAKRMQKFLAYMEKVQYALEGQEEAETENSSAGLTVKNAREMLTFFCKLDYLDQRFVSALQQAQDNCEKIIAQGLPLLHKDKERLYEWEHVAVYLLYRYLTEAVYDSDVLTRSRLVAVCLKLLAILAGQIALDEGYTESKRDELLRIFSREIEYCPENMEAVFEGIREGYLG